MKVSHTKKLKNSGGTGLIDIRTQTDPLLARVARNIEKVYNPHLRPGQRACHHGFAQPAKRWTSRLEEAMLACAKKSTCAEDNPVLE